MIAGLVAALLRKRPPPSVGGEVLPPALTVWQPENASIHGYQGHESVTGTPAHATRDLDTGTATGPRRRWV
ncbi:MAG TPA: hypothetical protein VN864_08550 [Thermoplasmata archaeon]|nr:hypothetical protein [Thermoplasmata archaeon]